MFGNILGRKKEEISEEDKANTAVVERIAKMNLTDMRTYVKNRMKGFEPCEDGLVAVMNRLLTKNEDTLKRYIEIDDMDSKVKKGFELVLSVAEHKKVTVTSVEQIQEFITLYDDIILKFDTANKQIYSSRLNDALDKSLKTIETMAEINRKAEVLA